MEKYLRKKCLHHIGEAAKAKLKFNRVEYRQVAGLSPDAINLPSLFIFRGNDSMEDLTNVERKTSMLIHVVCFVQDDTDAEAQKADMQDQIEEIIYEDITLGGHAVHAIVKNADPSAFSLSPLGWTGGVVLSPLAAFRMDIECVVDYGAFT